MNRLPPLNGLRAFETSARCGSFVLAAQALGVSSAAVSLQVKGLERYLDKQLFKRQGNRLLLTDAGSDLYPKLANAFDEISNATENLRYKRDRRRLVVSVMPSLAELWLAPKILRLYSPKAVQMDIRVQDDPVGIERDGIDVRLTYASSYYAELREEEIFSDVVHPVCTPGFGQEHGDRDGNLTAVPEEKLIHINWGENYASNPGWADWFRTSLPPRKLSPIPGLVISNMSMGLAVCRGGVGVMLAPAKMIEEDICAGTLIFPSRHSLPMPKPYVCVFSHARSGYPPLRNFLTKLRSIASG